MPAPSALAQGAELKGQAAALRWQARARGLDAPRHDHGDEDRSTYLLARALGFSPRVAYALVQERRDPPTLEKPISPVTAALRKDDAERPERKLRYGSKEHRRAINRGELLAAYRIGKSAERVGEKVRDEVLARSTARVAPRGTAVPRAHRPVALDAATRAAIHELGQRLRSRDAVPMLPAEPTARQRLERARLAAAIAEMAQRLERRAQELTLERGGDRGR